MPALLSLGLHSAYDVVAVPEDVFLELYGHKFPSRGAGPARLSQGAAGQQRDLQPVHDRQEARQRARRSPACRPPAEVRESVKNELIKHFPTMESLFGSMDFCECEHCRSVLSPAAYLVDLLQFVDTEPPVWDNFLERLEGRARRRRPTRPGTRSRTTPWSSGGPTCRTSRSPARTPHTALPYIDIVNEILEYYVAHDALTEEAAQRHRRRHHRRAARRAAERDPRGLRQAARGALPARAAVRPLARDRARSSATTSRRRSPACSRCSGPATPCSRRPSRSTAPRSRSSRSACRRRSRDLHEPRPAGHLVRALRRERAGRRGGARGGSCDR